MTSIDDLNLHLREPEKMSNFLKIILSVVIVIVVWSVIGHFLTGIVSLLFSLAMLGLFIAAIVYVYKLLTRQKI